jgi:hypothetical protein
MIKFIAALLTAFLTTGLAAAADDDAKFIKDQNGCKVVNPNPRAEETITWTGKCGSDGYTQGSGVLQWYQSGVADEKYEGEMSHGYAEGKGVQTMIDGGRYEGEFKESRQHGEGTYYGPDGSVFKGSWQDGKPHGPGVLRTPEGKVIRGEWENGTFKGGDTDRESDPNRT